MKRLLCSCAIAEVRIAEVLWSNEYALNERGSVENGNALHCIVEMKSFTPITLHRCKASNLDDYSTGVLTDRRRHSIDVIWAWRHLSHNIRIEELLTAAMWYGFFISRAFQRPRPKRWPRLSVFDNSTTQSSVNMHTQESHEIDVLPTWPAARAADDCGGGTVLLLTSQTGEQARH